jgi:hypothetical protein
VTQPLDRSFGRRGHDAVASRTHSPAIFQAIDLIRTDGWVQGCANQISSYIAEMIAFSVFDFDFPGPVHQEAESRHPQSPYQLMQETIMLEGETTCFIPALHVPPSEFSSDLLYPRFIKSAYIAACLVNHGDSIDEGSQANIDQICMESIAALEALRNVSRGRGEDVRALASVSSDFSTVDSKRSVKRFQWSELKRALGLPVKPRF